MHHHRSQFAAAFALAMTGVVTGGSCLVEESFTGGSGFTWTPWYTSDGAVYPNVNGGALYFQCGYNFSGYSRQGGVETSSWALDLDDDFAFTVTWHNGAQNTVSGYIRLNCVLKTYGSGYSEYPSNGVVLSLIKTGNGDSTLDLREWTTFYNGGVTWSDLQLSNTEFQTSSFVYYTASDQLIVDGRTITGLRAATGQYVELAFTAGSYYIPSQSAQAVSVSDVCFTSGGFAGALTGACCMTDSCVQGFAANCNGTFQGQGTSCTLLGACYDTECSGDFTMDGIVDADDVLAVVEGWSSLCTPDVCVGDGTTLGIAGVGDLIVILRSWGTCS